MLEYEWRGGTLELHEYAAEVEVEGGQELVYVGP
jgi:hypothetical protein